MGPSAELDSELPGAMTLVQGKQPQLEIVWVGVRGGTWAIERHPLSGLPVGRVFVAGALAKPAFGQCALMFYEFRQEYFNDTFGPTTLGRQAGGGGRLDCEAASGWDFGYRKGQAAPAAPAAADPATAPADPAAPAADPAAAPEG